MHADEKWGTRLDTLLKQHSTEGMGALLRLRLLKWAMKKAAEELRDNNREEATVRPSPRTRTR